MIKIILKYMKSLFAYRKYEFL